MPTCARHCRGSSSAPSENVIVACLTMVYIYMCKRFKVTMELGSGRESDWVNNLLQFYCKHSRIDGKLERAEINPKKRTHIVTFDSSTDMFKINLVYKDSLGSEHELKWVIKVARSDESATADFLLRHEKQVFSRLLTDLINTVKQRAASRMEGSRIAFADLLQTPEFIYEETAHQADLVRTVLVLENLEEKDYACWRPGPFNLGHMRVIVKTLARFHAVSLTYKHVLFSSFQQQSAQAHASRKMDEVFMEGDHTVLTGRHGLFARFPFLAHRQATVAFLIDNRRRFMDMFQKFLSCFPEESHLVDIFEYIRISTEDILYVDKDPDSPDVLESPLDSITLGLIDSKSFLFHYDDDEDKENDKMKRGKKNAKIQRSQSERAKDRTSFDALRKQHQHHGPTSQHPHHPHPHPHPHPPHQQPQLQQPQQQQQAKVCFSPTKTSPTTAKCLRLDSVSAASGKVQNKFLQNVMGKSKDDEKVPLTTRRGSKAPKQRHPDQSPKSAALVNAKFVTYGSITKDLAVLFWISGSTLLRRYYLIGMLSCYSETLGITLGQLGIDTDSFGLRFQDIMMDFQQHLLYGFMLSVLSAMSATSPDELDALAARSRSATSDGASVTEDSEEDDEDAEAVKADTEASKIDFNSSFLPLTVERVEYLRDLMRDVGAYIESKDFEQGLPITNFARYHELWSALDEDPEDDEDDEDEDEDEDEGHDEEELEDD